MQLLKITTTPIEYEIYTEPASLVAKKESEAKSKNVNYKPEIKNQSKVLSDKSSINPNFQQVIKDETEKNAPNKNEVDIEKYVQMGNKFQKEEMISNSINRVINQTDHHLQLYKLDLNKIIEEQSNEQTNFKNTINECSNGLDDNENCIAMEQHRMEYIPYKFRLEIIEMPKVEIEYLGGFTYVPASSDPNYDKNE